VRRPLLEQHVRLVQQQHRAERLCQVEHALQLSLHRAQRRAQLARRDDVHPPPHELGHGLGRHHLAETRRAVQLRHEALALALDEVVELGALRMVLDQHSHQFLLRCRQHQLVEHAVVEHDIRG